ncbi:archease [Coxiella burnetii]|uniref:archease n=1 Tax=Coxiella burnetii TaxID=777 RepID=UPI0021B0568A|nr:archease [Coxiella burnetii]
MVWRVLPIKDINYFDHEADIGIIGFGETVEKAFINAAEALFAIMVEDLSRVKQEASVAIEFEESDLELALVTWLNLLGAQARSHNLVFGDLN